MKGRLDNQPTARNPIRGTKTRNYVGSNESKGLEMAFVVCPGSKINNCINATAEEIIEGDEVEARSTSQDRQDQLYRNTFVIHDNPSCSVFVHVSPF